MGQGKDVPEYIILVIHEDVGFSVVTACREGAGTFSLVFITVDPAPEESLFQGVAVLISQGSKGRDDGINSLFVAVPDTYFRRKGNVDVPVTQRIDSQFLPAKGVVPVQYRQVFMNHRNKVIVDLLVNLIGKQSGSPGRGIIPYLRPVDIQMHAAGIKGCQGVFMGLVMPVELTVGLFPQVAVRIHQNEILSRKKNEKLLAETLKDREAMLSELHHRIMNNLQTFSSILTLQKTFLHDNNARQQIEETAKRVLIMGLFHKKLYQSQNFSNIDFKDFISSIVDEIKTKNESKTAPIEFHVDIQEIQTNIDTAIICGLIIYEIVSNSINHAFNGRDRCIIGITASALENNLNKLSVYDNGTGLPDTIDLNKNHGLGLLIIKMLVEELEGSVTIDRKDGTEYTILYKKMLKEENRWQKSE